jgi:transposase
LDLPASPDTLLRRVKETADEPAPAPRYVGVDDWAIRKGQRYGTILIDLERGRVLDLLPGRDGAALTAWLKSHPRRRVDHPRPLGGVRASGGRGGRHKPGRWRIAGIC